MADGTDCTSNGCTFQWRIENIRHCGLKAGEKINSPKFTAHDLQGSKWFLKFYPSIYTKRSMAYVLSRDEDCSNPDIGSLNVEIAVLERNGIERTEKVAYSIDDQRELNMYEEKPENAIPREVILSTDTLTLQCTIWNTDQKPTKTERFYARSAFNVNRGNFVCRIEEFSSLKYNKKHAFKDSLIEFDIALKDTSRLGEILVLNMNSYKETIKYFSFKFFIVVSGGGKEFCGKKEYYEGDLKKGELCSLFPVEQLMSNRCKYLPDDVLAFEVQYTSSDGTISDEQYGCGIISPKLAKSVNETDIDKERSKTLVPLAKDLKSMYNDQILSDIEIRTPTHAFPVHKNILCARSPVFRKMFNNEIKEISGHVDIDDLEDDTVHRMLLYMYTDNLDDLQYENARKLYVAADKYEILPLREMCASFIKSNLCPETACDILTMAHKYKDYDLKSFVHDFILKHDIEIMSSKEFKDLMETNKDFGRGLIEHYFLSRCD